MKIAIVAPSPVPYTVGGAEKMWWGLQREINTNTSHQCEIIKLPTKEHSFWDLIDSYEAFGRLDVSAFDLVITTKYPAWMVSHPRHICYMQHRLRGLYDHYHLTRLPERFETAHPELARVQRILEAAPSREGVTDVFGRLRELRYDHEAPPEAWEFPGPLIRQVIHYVDAVALRQDAIARYCAISQTVAQRASYFPPGAAVQVLHHPSNLEGFASGAFDYLFTASRIDGAKRIGLLLDAMKLVQSDVQLRIAGEGPDRERLEEASKGDRRIRFVGFRSDSDLVEDYANALAVPFVPFEEDFGLITIEAMMSGKPVITTTDSGGPTEFVEHGRTGICVAPAPEQLAGAIDRLARDREFARRMGEMAQARVSSVTWENVVRELLAPTAERERRVPSPSRARRKLTVATTFPLTPVRGGGQARIFHLYKNLVPEYEVELITLGHFQEPSFAREIAPGMREIRIAKSAAHTEAENNIAAEVDWFSITDVIFPRLAHLTPDYAAALQRSACDAEAVVASHPYALRAIRAVTDKPVWYEAHNVEYTLKSGVIPKTGCGLRLIEEVRRIEQECCDEAVFIMACSEEDRRQLHHIYGAAEGKTHVVPNGIDTESVEFVPRGRARQLKQEIGASGEFLALFMGSWHPPNIQAVEEIFRLAELCPDVQFLIVGSSSGAFSGMPKPRNLGFFGVLDDAAKSLVASAADLALNPMRGGSGTNLKMLEYAAAGVPILSTGTGARGLDFEAEREIFVAPLEHFAASIQRIRGTSLTELQTMASRARERVELQFDWRGISRRLAARI